MTAPIDTPDPDVTTGPLAPASVRTGAVIAFRDAGSTEEPAISADEILDAVEAVLTDPSAAGATGDRWLRPDVPALSRGAAWIVPLSWEPPPSDDEVLRARAGRLWKDMRGACENRHGAQIGIDLSADDGSLSAYAAELTRTGARRADWWQSGDHAIVLIVYGPPLPEPKTAIALQVVPRSWVWDDARRAAVTRGGPRPDDLRWSWADVVSFAHAGKTEAADGRSEQKKEGRES